MTRRALNLDPADLSRADEWRRGWRVVLGCALGFGTGGGMILLVIGLFIIPMKVALGWSISAVAMAPLITLAWALSSPFAGALIDRIGARNAALVGSAALAGCTLIMALAPMSMPLLQSVAVGMGLSCALTLVPTYARAVKTWFKSGLGLALGLTMSGSALVSILALPYVGTVIAQYGWRAGFVAVASLTVCIGIPAILFGCRERSGGTTEGVTRVKRKGQLKGVLKIPAFWLYNAAFAISCISVGGFASHIQPILAETGVPLSQALALGVALALSVVSGRIGGGYMLDHLPAYFVAAGALVIAAMGAISLFGLLHTPVFALLLIAVVAVGFGQGAEGDYPAFFAQRSFDPAVYSTLIGVFVMATALGLTLGALGFGMIADRTGSYGAAVMAGAGCYLIAAVVMGLSGWAERVRQAGR